MEKEEERNGKEEAEDDYEGAENSMETSYNRKL